MKRLILPALVALAPAASAQDGDRVEGEKLAAAFAQADLETLGACQARIEGAGLLLRSVESWLISQNQGEALASLRSQVERGPPLSESFAEVRTTASTAKGLTRAPSDAAYIGMRDTFTRRDGEDERAFYSRAQPETRLPAECRDALKRGRWKIEIDGLGEGG